MAEHTKGPWKSDDDEIWTADGAMLIARLTDADDFPCLDPDEHDMAALNAEFAANARLIAAAPDLHDALLALLPEGWADDGTMDHMPGVKLARAALAKARGEQQP